MILIFVAVLVPLLFISSPIIFQEGNPVPLAIGMVKLQITDESVVGIPGKTKRYLVRATSEGDQPFLDFMNSKEWSFKDQAGASLFFTKNNEELAVKGAMYTRKYRVYTFGQ